MFTRNVCLTLILTAGLSLAVAACRSTQADYLREEESPGVEHPESAGFRVVTRTEIDPPSPAFNFSLTDRSGARVSLEDLSGQVVMLSFIYTNCPEACPLVAGNFLQIQKAFADAVDQGELTQALITTDPARDTPERLQLYTESMGGKWFFLTGSLDEVQPVWDGYGIYREVRERTEAIVVFHSYKTFLIDRQGRLRFEFVGVWYPDDISADIDFLLSAP